MNSSLDTFDQSAGGTFIERHLIDWTASRIGFGRTADGVFTSGGSQSNLQALLLAREQAAARGVPASEMRILTSTDSHFSIQKSARLLGLGDAVVVVPTDGRRRLDALALSRALADCLSDGLAPVAVVATAGTTDFGAIDPLRAVAGLCRTYGAWFHVDAAYGGGLLVSTRRRPPPGGHRARGLGHHRLPQVLVPARLRQRSRRPRPRGAAARHLARRLPQPPRAQPPPTRWTRVSRRPAASTLSSCG